MDGFYTTSANPCTLSLSRSSPSLRMRQYLPRRHLLPRLDHLHRLRHRPRPHPFHCHPRLHRLHLHRRFVNLRVRIRASSTLFHTLPMEVARTVARSKSTAGSSMRRPTSVNSERIFPTVESAAWIFLHLRCRRLPRRLPRRPRPRRLPLHLRHPRHPRFLHRCRDHLFRPLYRPFYPPQS